MPTAGSAHLDAGFVELQRHAPILPLQVDFEMVPIQRPFDLRYTGIPPTPCEACRVLLARGLGESRVADELVDEPRLGASSQTDFRSRGALPSGFEIPVTLTPVPSSGDIVIGAQRSKMAGQAQTVPAHSNWTLVSEAMGVRRRASSCPDRRSTRRLAAGSRVTSAPRVKQGLGGGCRKRQRGRSAGRVSLDLALFGANGGAVAFVEIAVGHARSSSRKQCDLADSHIEDSLGCRPV